MLIAAVTALFASRFVLQPLFGVEQGKEVSLLVLFFVYGYLGAPGAPQGRAPLPLASWFRLRMALILTVVVGLVFVLPDLALS